MFDDIGRELWAARLAGDDDAIGRRQSLAGNADFIRIDAGLGGFAEEKIDDFVGYPVADFIGMAFRDGFASEQIVLPSHEILQNRQVPEKVKILSATAEDTGQAVRSTFSQSVRYVKLFGGKRSL